MRDNTDPFARFFQLKSPCANCPFRKAGTISLMPGRAEEIIGRLTSNDSESFLCHKTLNNSSDDDDLEEHESEKPRSIRDGEKMCAGAATYLMKAGRPSIGMRYAIINGSISKDHWESAESLVIDPVCSNTTERWQTQSGLKAPQERQQAESDAWGESYDTRQVRDCIRTEPHCTESRSPGASRPDQ